MRALADQSRRRIDTLGASLSSPYEKEGIACEEVEDDLDFKCRGHLSIPKCQPMHQIPLCTRRGRNIQPLVL